MVQEPFTLTDPLPVQRAAIYLSVSRWTVYRWIRLGHLQAIRFGGILFITTTELDRILDHRRQYAK